MKSYIAAYAVTALIFLGLDAVWLSTMAKLLYRPLLGDMMMEKPSLAPAIAFYILYIGGIVFFVTAPALETGRWTTALLRGAIFGLVAYATYDLTNMATLKNWSPIVTWADLVWGTFATSAAATLGYLVVVSVLKLGRN